MILNKMLFNKINIFFYLFMCFKIFPFKEEDVFISYISNFKKYFLETLILNFINLKLEQNNI